MSSFFVDRAGADLAAEFMALFGKEASREAAGRARRFRDRGNVIGYCRWRQVERLISALEDGQGATHH
jgi:hypothetical protein